MYNPSIFSHERPQRPGPGSQTSVISEFKPQSWITELTKEIITDRTEIGKSSPDKEQVCMHLEITYLGFDHVPDLD